jgi:hypothetical protein
MPTAYIPPKGDKKLEFWKTFRGGERSAFIQVPADWSDDQIKDELEDWCQFHLHNSDFMRYGWNEEEHFGNRELKNTHKENHICLDCVPWKNCLVMKMNEINC